MIRKVASRVVLLLVVSGCALYSEVSISPLMLSPASIERGADIQASMRRADFLRAIELAAQNERRAKRSVNEIWAIGTAYLAAGRYDDARRRLRSALDLGPFRTTYAQIAWDLSQVEYLENNYDASLEWARIAVDNGMLIKRWHLDYLAALAEVPVYRFSGDATAKLAMNFGRPDVPRVTARVNGAHDVEAIIDTGAVLSIVSERFAASLPIKPLGTIEGQFFGLVGEAIPVRFGMLESVQLGGMIIENVPVAVMPDEKMRFVISETEKREFRMDFLLGVNLLKEFRMEMNFDHHLLTLTKLADRERRPVANQNLFFDGFRPHVRGTINKRGWYLFMIDTGSEVTFLNDRHIAALPIAQLAPRAHDARLQGLGGSHKRGAKVEDVEVGIDRWAGLFKTLPMYTADDKDKAVGILGENYLKHFNVVLDFGRMRLDLERR